AERLHSMGLDDEAIQDTLEGESDLAGKVETYCIVIKEKEGDIDALKKEIERLQARIKSEDTAIKRMKESLKYGLQCAGETKLKAGTFMVSIRTSAGSVAVIEE